MSTATWTFAAWTALLCAAASWELTCDYTAYDLRRSSPDCLRHKDSAFCQARRGRCISPAAIASASPRPLAALAGDGGPLIMWLPLFAANDPAQRRAVLPATLLWYLAFIGPVRDTHRMLASSWDPSGHVYVYGAQLVPMWLMLAPTSRIIAGAAFVWACVLVYLSATTGARRPYRAPASVTPPPR